jgi:membrane protein implicated in regulation of membrane protease activity
LVLVLVARQGAVGGTVARPGSRVVVYEELVFTRAEAGRAAGGLLEIGGIIAAVEASSAPKVFVWWWSLLLLLLLLLLVLLIATSNRIPYRWHMAISSLVVASERHDDDRCGLSGKVATKVVEAAVRIKVTGPLGLGVSGVYLV